MIQNNNHGNPYGHNNEQLIELERVDNLTLADYGFTADAVKSNHFGIAVTDPRTGEFLPNAFYESKLETAIARAEKMLDVIILPRLVSEHHDFFRNDFESFMHIHTHHKPILQVEQVKLEYGESLSFSYPTRWWKVYKLSGHLEMMPSTMMAGNTNSLNMAQAYVGFPNVAGVPGVTNNNYAPQLFHITYVGGMLPPSRRGVTQPHEMHPDLWDLIIKITLREVFQQWGRLIIGAGIASMSTSMDGVSQSIDTTQSAMYGGASAEIVQLDKDIEELKQGLKSYYGNNLGII